MNKSRQTPDISVIVVSYNTRELTIKAIETLQQQTQCRYELIVIDNASPDGSAEALEARFPGTILIKSETNLGFAAANNLASEHANGKYILLLNPDTEILDHAVDQLYNFAESNPDCGIWGGRTLYSDLTLNPASCWMRQTMWSLFCQGSGLSSLFRNSSFFNPEAIGGWSREGDRKVDIVSGCFLLIRTNLWRELDGFKSKYFMYGEEADMCLRSHALGTSPRVTSKATIIHHGGKSETIMADKLVRLMIAKFNLVNDHFEGYISLAKVLLNLWPLSRYIAHIILVRLGRARSVEAEEVWREVWNRRKEWRR